MSSKGRVLRATKAGNRVPEFNMINYRVSLIHALNWYSTEIDDPKKKRAFAYTYWNKQGKQTKNLDILGDHCFKTVGALAHMALNELPLHQDELARIDTFYISLSTLAENIKPEEKEEKKPVVAVQDKSDEIAAAHIAEIEAAIDTLMYGAGQPISIKDYLTSHQVKAPVIRKIAEWFKPQLDELTEAHKGEDKFLVEAYSHFGKRNLKKLIDFVQQIISDCSIAETLNKTTKAPRVRKEKPPSVLVKDLRCMREFAELGLRSIDTTKIIGATEVYIFNTKIRRIFKYTSNDGNTLTVRGTVLQNWNPETSGSKIVRKPETIKGCKDWTKRPWNKFFSDIKGVMTKANGRTNEECLILAAF